ncbi:MAG: cytochrome b5 domain-containing protein [Desulfuromonadales bacterium]
MTREELAANNGRDGGKAFVAVNGTVYDFTESKMWKNGDHEGQHQAGRDLTEELQSAPHVRAVIERFPVVGTLEEEPVPKTTGGAGKWIAVAVIIAVVIVAFMVLR